VTPLAAAPAAPLSTAFSPAGVAPPSAAADPSSTDRPPRRRGGRPPFADRNAVRRRTVGVRVSPAELEELAGLAAAAGVDVATWLRLAGLRRRPPRPPVPEINRRLYAELGRVGGLLNQLAAEAHRGRVVALGVNLRELHALLQRVRLELLGTAPPGDEESL